MIEEFRDIYSKRFSLLRERKAQGKRIIGWACIYVPEEIIYAADILPIRVLGGAATTSIADAYFYNNACTFVRNCLELVLKGDYNFLDGFVTTNTCDHIRRLYDIWRFHIEMPYVQIFNLPCKADESVLESFLAELRRIKVGLEERFKVEITDDSLREAISVYNKTRDLLRQLYNLKMEDSPPITGAETLEVILAGLVISKDEYNLMLERLLNYLKGRKAPLNNRPRFLIMGSELDDPDYLRMIEDLGCLIVIDDECNGSKYFWDIVDNKGDPLEALARRYLMKPPCPHMHPSTRRKEHLKELVEKFKVEGIIYQTIKFCDSHAEIYPIFKDYFGELGIPHLQIEREYILGGVGQTRTRVQAFLESLNA